MKKSVQQTRNLGLKLRIRRGEIESPLGVPETLGEDDTDSTERALCRRISPRPEETPLALNFKCNDEVFTLGSAVF